MSNQGAGENPMYRGSIWGALPAEFPTDRAEFVYRRLIDDLGSDSKARRLMGFGFTGVAYRFKAMFRHGLDLEESIATNGLAPPVDIVFKQENSLFSFFVSGMSALDCFFFALHSMGAHYAPDCFDLESNALRSVKPRSVTEAFEEEWPNEPISLAIRHLIDSAEFKRWKRVRNVVTHRAVPPRAITIRPGQSTQAVWQVEEAGVKDADEEISKTTTSQWLEWISSQMHKLWSALEYFPPSINNQQSDG